MKISVIGTGYVGLVTGVCLAEAGHTVTCIDKDSNKIELLANGKSPIFEPGLEKLIVKNLKKSNLSFKVKLDDKVLAAEIIFIAVGTPSLPNGRPDLSFIFGAAREISKKLGKTRKTIVIKSTVPPGTTRKIGKLFSAQIDLVFNPEFLREGSAIKDTLYPNRIVFGVDNKKPVKKLKKLFTSLVRQKKPSFLVVDTCSAEMIKYASNAFLATKISFINEIGHLCEKIGANVSNVAEGVGMDERIGKSFLKAGLGYGGSCFPKDTNGLDHFAGDHGHAFHLLKAVIDVNNIQKKRFIKKIDRELKGVKGKTIGLLGLAFKPNTDDIRESVAIDLIKKLIKRGAHLRVYDPLAQEKAKAAFSKSKHITFCNDPYEAADKTGALIISTEWDMFKNLRLSKIKKQMKKAIIFDGRNILDPRKVKKAGIAYHAVGGHDRS